MILVISSSYSYDQGTEYILDWLNYYNASFLRISLEDIYNGTHDVKIDIENNVFICDNVNLTKDINVIFYRKKESLSLQSNNSVLENDIKNEKFAVVHYLFHLLRFKKWLPHFSEVMENKLCMLSQAKRNGILIPKTIITNKKKDVELFKNRCGKIINKPIHYCNYYSINNETYTSNTIVFDDERISKLPNTFPLSLFQEAIESDFELRCFYLDNRFYSTAIFHKSTEYIDVKLNRNLESTNYAIYNLSVNEKEKINCLMKDLKLNTGSIDFIVNKGELYFLEVNPVGQFLFESNILNFSLDMKIAKWLIDNDQINN